jgi:WD40-like Beta Propeller Repeat
MFPFTTRHATRPRHRAAPSGLYRVSAIVAAVLLVAPASVAGTSYGPWGPAVPEPGVNTGAAEGCPIESPDGLSLYIASNRAGGTGSPDPNDIWVFHRDSIGGTWSAAENLGAPVNSPVADYCPTPLRGKALLFVSNRPGGCGGGDLYLGRNNPAQGWTIQHLGCDATGDGPNFPGGEFGPSLVETEEGTYLYFSSDGYDVGGDQDIYVSRQRADGSFAPATAVGELNTAVHDFMPNIRKDGLEMTFNSNRAGGFGGQDVYSASRERTSDAWSAVVNLGPNVNTAGNETRSSLSWDGTRLHFGRDGDIQVSTRVR